MREAWRGSKDCCSRFARFPRRRESESQVIVALRVAPRESKGRGYSLMHVIALRASSLALVVILMMFAAVGCGDLSGMPADQIQPVTDQVQTSYELDVYQLLTDGNFPTLLDAVSHAFSRTAGITLQYHEN